MRNWNLFRAFRNFRQNTVASLPMRNWNQTEKDCNLLLTVPLRAYLWGIETKLRKTVICFWLSRCEPTYEELKQDMEYSIGWEEAGLRAYLWGIETGSTKTPNPVFSLLRAYLWGIETFSMRLVSLNLKIVASLPMRNWNIDISNVFNNLPYVASLPMRNWNLESLLHVLYIELGCEPTYEECY